MNMNKDIIELYDYNGNITKAEVCLLVRLNSSKRYCIIYKKNNNKTDYYVAHFDNKNIKNTKLDYNFTEEEKYELKDIFNNIVEV